MNRNKKKESAEDLVIKVELEEDIDKPTLVRFLGKNYSIDYIDRNKGQEDLGNTLFHEQQVLVQNNLHPAEEADVLLHEFIHVIDLAMELDLSEHQVRVLASGIYALLQDNPDFAEFITHQRI